MESREKLQKNMNVHLAGRDYVVIMTNYMGNNASIDRALRAAGKKLNLEAAYLKEIGAGCKENQNKQHMILARDVKGKLWCVQSSSFDEESADLILLVAWSTWEAAVSAASDATLLAPTARSAS